MRALTAGSKWEGHSWIDVHNPTHLLGLVAVAAACCAYDLRRTLVTGRARTWPGGTVTRAHQPRRYWRYVYGSWFFLAFCAAAFLAVILWPDYFR